MAIKRAQSPSRKIAMRVALVVIGCALLWFSVEGGEYGTRALFSQHTHRQQLELDVAQLKHEVDSLQTEKQAVLKNDAVLERIAREQYGMLRGSKELLFWLDNAGSRSPDAHGAASRKDSVRIGDTLSGR